MSDFFSQVTNFGDALQGSVDPRAGTFSAVLQLGNITGNDLQGPGLALALQYSVFDPSNHGLGIGWSFNWTQFSSEDKRLFAATGEQFKTAGLEDTLQQQKMPTLAFKKIGTSAYHVYHRSDTVELLKGSGNGYKIKVPDHIYAPSGKRLNLGWTADYADEYWLASIRDDGGNTLLTVDYTMGTRPAITVWPDSPDAYTVTLQLRNNLLVSAMNGDHVWQFDYDNTLRQHYCFLTSIQHATGLTESVEYDPLGHQFPDPAIPPFPCVKKYSREPHGGQAATVWQYAFSAHNFLGYDSGSDEFSPDMDNLFDCPRNDYEYQSFISVMAGDTVLERTTSTFNKFHLVTNETVSRGDCIRDTVVEYYALPNGSFDAQPDNYQFMKNITVTFKQGDGSSDPGLNQEVFEYDLRGNCTYHKDRQGTVTEWKFYPLAGEGDACPPHPNPLAGASYCKSETVTAPDSPYPVPVHQQIFTYTALAAEDEGAPLASFVLPASMAHYADGRIIRALAMDYVTRQGGGDYGRFNSTTETLYDETQTPYVTKTAYGYAHDTENGRLSVTRTSTACDGLKLSSREILSVRTGLLMASTDQRGCETVFTYDRFGRPLSQITAPGTPYEQSLLIGYAFAPYSGADATAVTLVTKTRTGGISSRVWYDGMMSPVKSQRKVAGEWHDVRDYRYDPLRQRVAQVSYDEFDSGNGSASRVISNETTYRYDDWGQRCQTDFADGRVLRSLFDPLHNTLTEYWNSSGAYRVTQYNRQHLPATVTLHDEYGQTAQSQMDYDGAGYIRRYTDERQCITTYAYDDWGRVRQTVLPDGSTLAKHYAPQGRGPEVDEITMNGVTVGTQRFDGFLRVTGARSGGREFRYDYDDGATLPKTAFQPDGTAIGYTWIAELTEAPASCSAGALTQTFTYDKTFPGRWSTAAETGNDSATVTLAYDEQGRLSQQAVRLGDEQQARASRYGYSLFGRPTGGEDIKGQEQVIDYDSRGRVSAISDGELSASLRYDGEGRLTHWVARGGGLALTVDLTLDGLNREITRTITGDGGTLTVTQAFLKNNARSERQIRFNQQTLNEYFTYDARNRLERYECEGELAPQDGYGHVITSQTFTYDALSNITQVTTLFPEGQNIAYFDYTAADPCQLMSIRNTHASYPPSIWLQYDANGRLVMDSKSGRLQSYDALGRLGEVNTGNDRFRYGYDAFNRLRSQTSGGGRTQFYYQSGELTRQLTLTDGQETITRWLRLAGAVAAANTENGESVLFGSDESGTARLRVNGQESAYAGYSAYGERAAAAEEAGPGYNGQRFDGASGSYLLGNGYRAYNPSLMRFTAPDSWSPFGAGGVNPYAYCDGDPVNRADPSGHFKLDWTTWAGIGLSVGVIVVSAVLFKRNIAHLRANKMQGLRRSAYISAGLEGLNIFYSSVHLLENVVEEVYQSKARSLVANTLQGEQRYDNNAEKTYQVLLKIDRIMSLIGLALMAASVAEEYYMYKTGGPLANKNLRYPYYMKDSPFTQGGTNVDDTSRSYDNRVSQGEESEGDYLTAPRNIQKPLVSILKRPPPPVEPEPADHPDEIRVYDYQGNNSVLSLDSLDADSDEAREQ